MLRRGVAVAVMAILLAPIFGGAAAAAEYAGVYDAPSVPPSMGAGSPTAAQVAVRNTGSVTWTNSGSNPVNLSYHWYTSTGAMIVLDGVRTALPKSVGPNDQVTVTAQISPPSTPGTYQLRFALVKEGVTWFEPEPVAHAVSVGSALASTFGAITLPTFVSGQSATTSVPVANSGTQAWNATGTGSVRLAYHWFDARGNVVVWDGIRTNLPANVAAGDSPPPLTATIQSPKLPGTYVIALEMVKEGVAWFGNRWQQQVAVEAAYRGEYVVGVTSPVAAATADTRKIPVTVKNTGKLDWTASGSNPVRLSYHWLDGAGRVVEWDGLRTALSGDVPAGGEQPLELTVRTPASSGTFVLSIDLVREGDAWFSWLGAPPATLTFQISLGYSASYGAHNMPGEVSFSSEFDVKMQVTNTGSRTWPAGGPTPVRLSYHWYWSLGLADWEGNRGSLPKDVGPNETVEVTVRVRAPSAVGTFTIHFDLVQEGVTWFSWQGVATKQVAASIPGVVFHGKGWGHGVGMSQWGAQGWANGVTGTALTAEQIIARYYAGTELTDLPADTRFRVLLSSPSTGCIARTITSIAQMRSPDGNMIVRNADNGATIMTAQPKQTIRVWVEGTTLKVMDEWHSSPLIYSGTGAISIEQSGPSLIIIDQKSPNGDPLRFDTASKKMYRGWLRFNVAGTNSLRVVNYVGADDYIRGAIPAEMPTTTGWHLEAFKSQAYAARTYARAQVNPTREFDLYDDTRDQCYGGYSVEKAITETATVATAGKIITYDGTPIIAYYSSSNGGISETNACVWNVPSTPPFVCRSPEPYLPVAEDPADLLAADDRGPQQHRAWKHVFTPEQIRDAVIRAGQGDIGILLRVDISNRSPSGRVISVRIQGTSKSVELRGDNFLRTTLGMKSNLVYNWPF